MVIDFLICAWASRLQNTASWAVITPGIDGSERNRNISMVCVCVVDVAPDFVWKLKMLLKIMFSLYCHRKSSGTASPTFLSDSTPIQHPHFMSKFPAHLIPIKPPLWSLNPNNLLLLSHHSGYHTSNDVKPSKASKAPFRALGRRHPCPTKATLSNFRITWWWLIQIIPLASQRAIVATQLLWGVLKVVHLQNLGGYNLFQS